MQLYLLFILMAVLTILSPGPGVLKSISNSLNYGFKTAFIGVLGLSFGVLCGNHFRHQFGRVACGIKHRFYRD